LRAPISAHTALPPAPATSSAVISGPACRAITAPNGIATSAVGKIVTLAKNQLCWTHSRNWNGRRKIARRTSHANVDNRPT
jgi:hypothetical protein